MSTANPAREAVATVPVRETGYIDSTSRVSRPMKTILWHILLASIAIVMAFPFVAMLLMAFRPESVVALSDILFSDQFTLDNFRMNLRNDSMVRWIFNSFVYSLVSVVLVLLLASMAGYAFAKKEFFARDKIFWLFVAMLVVPSQVTLVPLFILLVQLDGANTYWGLIVPTLANAQGVFLMRQYIRGIPDDLIEAAKLDGASEFRIFWQIILPLTIPVQATLGIFVFLWHWNDFLWPLIVAQSNEMRTLTVGLATLQSLVPSTNSMMAAAAISFAPSLLIFIFAQRFIVQSIATAGIKG
ncbi:MAG TPA: carbohydrate ABC transporter permease [Thermomicrobiales bacterium]|jgi:multiple sugar transport system permease protein|nr:carbohydrate ABC transporter permease [Thermomicrobiales bacterium]